MNPPQAEPANPASSLPPIDNDGSLHSPDLVESKIEDFIRLRRSQMTDQEINLAKSLMHAPGPGDKPNKDEEMDRAKDIFRIHRKEDDYFEKLNDLEQVRLYTSLHDHNNRLRENIQTLKKELLTLLQKKEGLEKLDMRELQSENKQLREELRLLTYKTDKETNMHISAPSKKKNLLKAYNSGKTTGAKPVQPNVVYVG